MTYSDPQAASNRIFSMLQVLTQIVPAEGAKNSELRGEASGCLYSELQPFVVLIERSASARLA